MDQSGKLISGEKLRAHFDPPPSLRTVRAWQANRQIPFVKIGNKVYFDPERVKDHLVRHNEIRPRP